MASKISKLHQLMELVAPFNLVGMFTTLLTLARSKTHLRELHGTTVTVACRLLRTDVVNLLEPAWEEIQPKHRSAEGALRWTEARQLLVLAAGEGNLFGYYLVALDKDRTVLRGNHIVRTSIFSEVEACGHGCEHFVAYLFGETHSSIGLELSSDGKSIVVRFVIWEKELSEPLTHKLLSQMPTSKTYGHYIDTMGGGREVDFVYEIPAEGLRGELEEGPDLYQRGAKILIATPKFLRGVLERLTEAKVPIMSFIRPITYK